MVFSMNTITSLFSSLRCDAIFKQIFLHSPQPLCVTDADGNILYSNHAFSQLTGYLENEIIHSNMSIFKSFKNDTDFFKLFWKSLDQHHQFNGKIWNQHKNGSHYLHHVEVTLIDKDAGYYLSAHSDVTKDFDEQERFRFLAFHDSLTGLANRTLLEDRLTHAIKNALRTGEKIGVLFCDLNEFKQLNDTYGHLIGDEILIEIAKQLRTFFRNNDTIARFGGDEFVIVVEQLKNDDELTELIHELKSFIRAPLTKQQIPVSLSIGHSIFPHNGLTKEQLLTAADARMYDQKNLFYGFTA